MQPLVRLALCVSLLALGCDDGGASPDEDGGGGGLDASARADAGGSGDAATDAGADDDAGGPECDATRTCEAGSVCEAGRCVPEASVELRDSVTQYGITWTFDRAYPVGQFVTGDFWVVGPVQKHEVATAPTGDRNGTMIDPVGAQAYDSRAGSYDASKAVALPVSVDPGHSVVSSISHGEPNCERGGGAVQGYLTYDGGCQRGPIETQAILTVLGDAPPADAFRPAYSSHAPTLYRAADLCWGRLPDLEAPEGAPDPDALLRHLERPWIDHLNSWTMQHGCATMNMYCYGREIGMIVSAVSAYVLLDTPARDELARRLVQLGIDNHGVLRAGGGWGGDGGHFNARKWPIVFAGGMLGDADMASPGTDIGNEDRMTYYGADGTALWGRACTSCYLSNGCSNDGACSSGAKDCRDPEGVVDGCADYRNCCTSRTWVGQALAAHLMGLREAWGHDAFFDYVDRWMDGGVPGGGGAGGDAFVAGMWDRHRDSAPASGCE